MARQSRGGPTPRWRRHTDEVHRPSMIAALRASEHKDLPALAKFLVRVYQFDPPDHHADTRLLEWKYLSPRPGWDGSRSYVLEKDGEIVAHGGVSPVTFRLPTGGTVSSLTITDWAADPSNPGVGVMLYRKLTEMAPTSFVIGGAPVTRQIVPRIGFRHVGDALTYTCWLRPWREFRTRPCTGRSVLRLLHGLAHPLPISSRLGRRWEFVPVREFDDSLQPILSAAKRTWTICQRTVADLNYLLKCPHLEMRGFLLRRQRRLGGYFILGKSGWEARLLDLVVDSEDVNDWKHACAAVTRTALLDPEVCRVRALCAVPILRQALARSGYWCQYKERIALHDPADALGRAFPVCFQLFDGDSGY
jgi:Acetyltransferase (GNAT) domain